MFPVILWALNMTIHSSVNTETVINYSELTCLSAPVRNRSDPSQARKKQVVKDAQHVPIKSRKPYLPSVKMGSVLYSKLAVQFLTIGLLH